MLDSLATQHGVVVFVTVRDLLLLMGMFVAVVVVTVFLSRIWTLSRS